MKWIKNNHPSVRFDLLLKKGGVMQSEFEEVAETFIYPSNSGNRSFFIKEYIQRKRTKLYKLLKKKSYSVIYSNTIMNGFVLEQLSFLKIPVITHAHEMDYWIEKAGALNNNYISKNTTCFITASRAVSECLVHHGITLCEKTEIVYAFIDVRKIENNQRFKSIKKELGLPIDALIIGACGAEDFRKGKDWFVPVATEVLQKKTNANIHFVWIGGGVVSENIKFDWDRCGFKGNIHFLNFESDANAYFNEFDLFLMLSREDPFPIVNLEAGIFEVPVICFNESGGTTELLKNGGGLSVPYANLSSFSEAIIKMLSEKEIRLKAGRELKLEILHNFDIEIIAAKIFSIINRVSGQQL